MPDAAYLGLFNWHIVALLGDIRMSFGGKYFSGIRKEEVRQAMEVFIAGKAPRLDSSAVESPLKGGGNSY